LPTSFSNSPVLAFEPHWSVQRLLLTFAQYLICVGVPWLIPDISILVRVLLNVASISLLSAGLISIGWWGRRHIRRITWQQSGDWVLTLSKSTGLAVWTLQPTSFVSPFLMVLRWHSGVDSAVAIIICGEMSVAEWRRWQARLRLQGCPRVSPKGQMQ